MSRSAALRAVVVTLLLVVAPVVAVSTAVGQSSCTPYGAIGATWSALGGPASVLGACTGPEQSVPGGRGQDFAGGEVLWSPQTGALPVRGAIVDEYRALGSSGSVLGLPTTAEAPTVPRVGAWQVFQGGSFYWSPGTAAHEVHGSIRSAWIGLGFENGYLGFPTTDELGTPQGTGRYNHFEGGSVYWSPATGAHSVRGSIRDAWAAQGWETGPLGFPTSDEYATGTGARSDFQGGSLVWDSRTGAVTRVGATGGGGGPVTAPPVPGTSVGAVALAAARTRLGAPYVWGAAGPSSFDCSGLVQWSFAQAGRSLPRTTYQQVTVGTPVSQAALQPGDVVFFYGDNSHDAIYVGGGQVIHAPQPGQSVSYAPLSSMPFSAARRM